MTSLDLVRKIDLLLGKLYDLQDDCSSARLGLDERFDTISSKLMRMKDRIPVDLPKN